ncbi:hypothetical protein AaE_015316 [Aphanomyces astaci]|uniref:HTH CENPB-type domain-containing protein n=1 Tax=Aphanomyces astaci TaxID=112090 RepID=A0A6A4Z8H5_APHAT|nr:hypothetical protein AaE_015316 [Aphanomyces astaci]
MPSPSPSIGRKQYYLVKAKIAIVAENTKANESAYATAKRHGLQTSQVSRWIKNLASLKVAAAKSPRKLTVGKGHGVSKPLVEAEVLAYCNSLRDEDIAVSTKMLIVKALSIDPSFHGGQPKALSNWVYEFLNRNDLCLRRPTRQGQKRSNHLQATMDDFVGNVNNRFLPFGTLANVPMNRLVNMDETPVYFEPKLHTTISKKGLKTVSARVCSSHNPRVSVCLAVTATGEKLPPYVVFKGVPGARIDSSLEKIMPPNMFGTCQKNAWMDDPTTEAWRKSVWVPFIGDESPSVLLLDDYKCHKQPSFTRKVAKVGTELEIIPGGYTCVLQPLDVGINKPFKDNIRHQYMLWAATQMVGNSVVASPSREVILEWIRKAWSEITVETILNAWRKCGYGYVV